MGHREAERKERLQDALVFSVIEKLTKGAARDLEMGKYLLSKGKLDAAELCFEQAIRKVEEEEEEKKGGKIVVAALLGKSEVLKRRKHFEKAYEVLSSAEELAAKLGSKLLGLVYQAQAEVLSAEGHWATALEKLKKAKKALSFSKDTASEMAGVTFKMGMAAGHLLQFHDALAYYEEAEKLAREAKNSPLILLSILGQTDALSGLGKAGEVIKKCDQAEEFLQAHKDELKNMNVRATQIKLLEKKAGSHQTLGHLEAAQLYEEALENSPDPKETAKLHSTMALLAFSMGKPAEARRHEGEVLKILEEFEGEIPEALLNLSRLNLSRGQINAADTQFLQALLELPKKVSKGQELMLQSHEISLKIQQGRVKEAQELAHNLYQELLRLNIKALLPFVLNTLGNIARLQGNVDEAKEFYQKSLEIAKHLQMPPLMVTSLAGLAKVAAARSEIPTALEHLDRALQISEKCGMLLQHQALLVDRATILGREGAAEEAIAALEELLRESRRFESLPLELSIEMALALAYWEEAHYAEAQQYLEDTIQKAAEAGMEFTKILAQGLLGLVLADLGEERLAGRYLEDALDAMGTLGLEIEAKHQFQERYRDLTGFWF